MALFSSWVNALLILVPSQKGRSVSVRNWHERRSCFEADFPAGKFNHQNWDSEWFHQESLVTAAFAACKLGILSNRTPWSKNHTWVKYWCPCWVRKFESFSYHATWNDDLNRLSIFSVPKWARQWSYLNQLTNPKPTFSSQITQN